MDESLWLLGELFCWVGDPPEKEVSGEVLDMAGACRVEAG
jgi:hypothetical protein